MSQKEGAVRVHEEFDEEQPVPVAGATPPLPPGGDEKFKLRLQLTRPAVDRLLVLAEITDHTPAGVVRDALGLYDFLQREVGPNDTLFLCGSDGGKTRLKF